MHAHVQMVSADSFMIMVDAPGKVFLKLFLLYDARLTDGKAAKKLRRSLQGML